jgi:hypothetical protein
MTLAPFVDAEGAFKDYLNTLTGTLVGQGKPLAHGAHLKPLRSPAAGAYVWLTLISGSPSLTAENPVGRARISGLIYGATKEAASKGATAYANLLASLDGKRTPMRDVICLTSDNIQGPSLVNDQDSTKNQYRYLVDADLFFTNM